jgi:hypothetical protein
MYAQYGGRRAPELYDVVADPRQESNLIETAEGKRLRPQLQEMLETLKKARRLR